MQDQKAESIYRKIEVNVTLRHVGPCPVCGIHFAIDTLWLDDLTRLGRSFFCPNGHSLKIDKPTKKG